MKSRYRTATRLMVHWSLGAFIGVTMYANTITKFAIGWLIICGTFQYINYLLTDKKQKFENSYSR